MRDGPLRRALKLAARARYALDVGAARLAARRRGDPPWALGGACRRCAACCEAPAIRVSRLTLALPALRRAFLAWQRHVNGFELAGIDRRARTVTFRCTHFDAATRACDSYDSRPGMCRDYPRGLLAQANPELLPGCGYRAVHPHAARMLAMLDGRGLPPEQRARLERDLRLR